jgi:hypothetical protein
MSAPALCAPKGHHIEWGAFAACVGAGAGRRLAEVDLITIFRLAAPGKFLAHPRERLSRDACQRIFGPGAEAFASTTAAEFSKTALPSGMVHAFLIVVPFAELVLGVLTTLGLDAGGPVDRRSGLRHRYAERLEHGGCTDDLRHHVLSSAGESIEQSFLCRRAIVRETVAEGRDGTSR